MTVRSLQVLLMLVLTPLTLARVLAAHAAPPATTALRFEIQLAEGLTDRPVTGRLLLALAPGTGGAEPRLAIGRTGLDAPPVLGVDVDNLAPGGTVVVDGKAAVFPLPNLDALAPGPYRAQATLHTNPDLNIPNAPDDLVGPAVSVTLDPGRGGTVTLTLDRRLPEESLPADTEHVRYLKIQSPALTAFHGRPMVLRAAVILPHGFEREPERTYPLRVHIGGYGSRFTDLPPVDVEGSEFRTLWQAADTPRFLYLKLDGAGPLGDPYQIDSANHGPYGQALTTELIPHVERTYRGMGTGASRVLDGGSTGGWVSLALQVFYPEFFNGCWSFCADGVDFRHFQLVNVYSDRNAYVNSAGFERPACRTRAGDVKYTMRHECALENVLGRGDSWTLSGGQWGAWNATYGPRGADGRPVPLWDPRTGVMNPAVRDHWKRYDLRLVLEANWAELGPRLRGKLHIWMGDADDFFLNNAMRQLETFLSQARPAHGGSIVFGPGQGHCWMGISEREMLEQMARATGARP